ncbi:hypothetical protein QUF72_20845 [Desulfobacterales bacterium HSG2]|nr:hypothetical protein [Desulfobacterales bacterium HSG2]
MQIVREHLRVARFGLANPNQKAGGDLPIPASLSMMLGLANPNPVWNNFANCSRASQSRPVRIGKSEPCVEQFCKLFASISESPVSDWQIRTREHLWVARFGLANPNPRASQSPGKSEPCGDRVETYRTEESVSELSFHPAGKYLAAALTGGFGLAAFYNKKFLTE